MFIPSFPRAPSNSPFFGNPLRESPKLSTKIKSIPDLVSFLGDPTKAGAFFPPPPLERRHSPSLAASTEQRAQVAGRWCRATVRTLWGSWRTSSRRFLGGWGGGADFEAGHKRGRCWGLETGGGVGRPQRKGGKTLNLGSAPSEWSGVPWVFLRFSILGGVFWAGGCRQDTKGNLESRVYPWTGVTEFSLKLINWWCPLKRSPRFQNREIDWAVPRSPANSVQLLLAQIRKPNH